MSQGQDQGAPVGYVLVAVAATFWGAQSVVAKILLTSGIPPSVLVSTRTALAFLIVAAAVAAVKPALLRVSARDLGHLVVLGIGGMALANYTYYFALGRLPIATVVLLVYTAPLIVVTASSVLYREPLRRGDLLAASLTLLGAALVVRVYEPAALRVNLTGTVACAFTAIAFAFYSLWGRIVAPRMSPWTMLTYSLAGAAVFWAPLAPPWTLLSSPPAAAVWLGLAVIVIFGTLVPFTLFLAGLARITASHASVTSTLEPVVAVVVAFLVLGESLVGPQLLGAALVLAGIGLLHARR